MYREMEVKIRAFLTSVLDGGVDLATYLGWFAPWKRLPVDTEKIPKFRGGLDTVEER
jgi:hypothetical protein